MNNENEILKKKPGRKKKEEIKIEPILLDNNVSKFALLQLRKKAGFSQEQMAAYLGIKQPSYSLWENGDVAINPETVHKICALLAITPNELYGIKDEPNYEAVETPCLVLSSGEVDVLTERELHLAYYAISNHRKSQATIAPPKAKVLAFRERHKDSNA